MARFLSFFRFKPAARYPADPRVVFILALSVFAGLTALALGSAPQSLEASLPDWAVAVWSISLSLGSLITLGGIAFQTVNGIQAEQIGSMMVGVAAIFYPVIAVATVGWAAVQVVGVIFAWGLACLWRWGQLQALLKDGLKRQAKEEMIHRIHLDIEARRVREQDGR